MSLQLSAADFAGVLPPDSSEAAPERAQAPSGVAVSADAKAEPGVALGLAETGHAAAMAAFERFRVRMEQYSFPQAGQVTVSVGFTPVQSTDAPSAAFSRADEAVYQAKHQGRNRVLSHSALVQAGAVQDTSHEGDVELF